MKFIYFVLVGLLVVSCNNANNNVVDHTRSQLELIKKQGVTIVSQSTLSMNSENSHSTKILARQITHYNSLGSIRRVEYLKNDTSVVDSVVEYQYAAGVALPSKITTKNDSKIMMVQHWDNSGDSSVVSFENEGGDTTATIKKWYTNSGSLKREVELSFDLKIHSSMRKAFHSTGLPEKVIRHNNALKLVYSESSLFTDSTIKKTIYAEGALSERHQLAYSNLTLLSKQIERVPYGEKSLTLIEIWNYHYLPNGLVEAIEKVDAKNKLFKKIVFEYVYR